MLIPANKKWSTNGMHISTQIKSAFEYLKSRDVKFVSVEDLILRLRDFITGWIDHEIAPNGSLQVTVHRTLSLVNQVKIQYRNNLCPIASGESVTSQVWIGNMLYVDLKPETESTFTIRFEAIAPDARMMPSYDTLEQ